MSVTLKFKKNKRGIQVSSLIAAHTSIDSPTSFQQLSPYEAHPHPDASSQIDSRPLGPFDRKNTPKKLVRHLCCTSAQSATVHKYMVCWCEFSHISPRLCACVYMSLYFCFGVRIHIFRRLRPVRAPIL